MEYRQLGHSGLRVSEIAYGNWLTHGQSVDAAEARACVRAALDAGITFFDTADVYALGRAEEILGESLSGVRRSDYVLASKVFWPTGEGPNDRGLSRKHIIESCHASLRRLRTDYLDLYQAHRFDPTVPLEETLRAFDDLVRAGKVLYIGVSEWTAGQMSHALRIAGGRGFDRLVSNQPQYSMLWRVIEAEVVPLCRAEGIGQIVWSPLAQGVLTGKYAPGSTPPKGSRATDQRGAQFIREFMTNDLLGRVQELRPVAAEAGLSMAALAVAWVLQNDTVSAAIIGASRPEQVTENVQGGGVRLDKELMTRIDEILDPVVQRNPALTGD
jgi:aryl-alcohol dehydrogenase-like predicted oxidoreductase